MTDATQAVADEALMLKFQRGDKTAFPLLVKRHHALVFNFVLRRIGGPAAAEDIVQETFVRVVQNARDFKHDARFVTWLYTIARNLCVDHLRRQSHRKHASLDAPLNRAEYSGPTLGEATANPQESVENQVASAEIKARIAAAVDQLPEDQREVFLLRETANISFKDIAEIAGVSENTVKSRMRYALERLQEALSDYEEYARALR